MRRLAQSMIRRSLGGPLAARAPFLHDPTARVLSALAVDVSNPAREAQRGGTPSVSPRVYGDPWQLLEGMGYMERRSQWMSRPRVLEAMGIQPPTAEVEVLREAVIEVVRYEATKGPRRLGLHRLTRRASLTGGSPLRLLTSSPDATKSVVVGSAPRAIPRRWSRPTSRTVGSRQSRSSKVVGVGGVRPVSV